MGTEKENPISWERYYRFSALLKQFEKRLVFGEMNLSEIVRSGAQMMLLVLDRLAAAYATAGASMKPFRAPTKHFELSSRAIA